MKPRCEPSNPLHTSLLVGRFGMNEETLCWRSEERRFLPALTPLARETKRKTDALARAPGETVHVSAFDVN